MSCREIERLFVSDGSLAAGREHAAGCPTCAGALRDHEEIGQLAASLREPAWSSTLRRALLSVPSRTVSCETADELIARAGDNEVDPASLRQLEFHLTRCQACAQAAGTLEIARRLAPLEPAPWLAGRIAASQPTLSKRRPRARAGWRWLLDPKAAIGLAYAAAVVLMIFGFNPADLARKARTELPAQAGSVVADAKASLADRVGALEERIVRAGLIVRSRIFGYGRAALSDAVQLVLKSESTSTPRRPINGQEKGALPSNETATTTWRA